MTASAIGVGLFLFGVVFGAAIGWAVAELHFMRPRSLPTTVSPTADGRVGQA